MQPSIRAVQQWPCSTALDPPAATSSNPSAHSKISFSSAFCLVLYFSYHVQLPSLSHSLSPASAKLALNTSCWLLSPAPFHRSLCAMLPHAVLCRVMLCRAGQALPGARGPAG